MAKLVQLRGLREDTGCDTCGGGSGSSDWQRTRYGGNRNRNDVAAPSVNINLIGGSVSPANSFGFGVSNYDSRFGYQQAPNGYGGPAAFPPPQSPVQQPAQGFPTVPAIPGLPTGTQMMPTIPYPKAPGKRVPQPEFY